MDTKHEYADTQNVSTGQRSEVGYPNNEYGTQDASTAAQLIGVQSEQIGRRLTFRDVIDRIMQGIQNGEFMMSDSVPDGFLDKQEKKHHCIIDIEMSGAPGVIGKRGASENDPPGAPE